MSGSIQLLSTPGTYSSSTTSLNASTDCRIKQKIGIYDTEIRWISLWSPDNGQQLLFIQAFHGYFSHAKLDLHNSTTIFTCLFKSVQTVPDFKGKYRTYVIILFCHYFILSLFYRVLWVSETSLKYRKHTENIWKCGWEQLLTNVQLKIKTWHRWICGKCINFSTTECIRGNCWQGGALPHTT